MLLLVMTALHCLVDHHGSCNAEGRIDAGLFRRWQTEPSNGPTTRRDRFPPHGQGTRAVVAAVEPD